MQKILEIFRTVPNYELARTWHSDMTIMLRMTSKSIREAVDNAQLPATVSLIWPIYTTDIIKINRIIRRLNITSLAIKFFDLETDEYFVDILTAEAARQHQREDAEAPPGADDNRYITKCPHDDDEVDDEDDDKVDDKDDDKVDDEVEVRLQEILKYEEDKLLKLSEIFSLNEGLTVLDLRQSELENNSFKFFKEAFPKLQNLSELNLDGNHFSWSLDFIELLMLLPKLVRLNLNSNPFINEKGCAHSGDILPGQILHLEELSLCSCSIACGTYDILQFIEICPKLVRLNLGDNGLDDNWVKRLTQALKQCPNLAYLDLSANYINAEGTTYITTLLKSHNFVSLELAYNNFGDEGVTNIANALSYCPNLTNLNLCDNKFGDEGATNIANALCNAQCPNLTNLNLSSNKIRNKGATNIVNALSNTQCPSLTCLDFRSNMIGDEGASNIAKVLPQCTVSF
jgi:hypothetical protein